MPEVLLDATDHEILGLLREDARRTLSDIAGRVTLSTAAVKRRIDRLRETGVIEAFTELRFVGNAKVDEILRTTTRMPEAQAVFTIAGDPDALVWLRVRDMAHLQKTIDEIRRHHQVTGTKTLIALESWSRGS